VRQSFNAGAPPALLVCLAVKVGGFSDEAVESQVAAVIAAFDAPLEPAATVSITVQRESARQGSVPTARAEAVLGKPWIDEVLCGRSFRVSPSAFFQVNSRGAEQLCHLLRGVAGLSATTTLLDVCCGTGTIGIALADGVRQVIGIEVNAEAVRDAERNAGRNQVTNVRFVAAKAEDAIQDVLASLDGSTTQHLVAIVDPPRAGLHPQVLRALRECTPLSRIVFVSCYLPAFVQNALSLCRPQGGGVAGAPFQLTTAIPVDLFPDTSHCEVVIVLDRSATATSAVTAAGATAARATVAAAVAPNDVPASASAPAVSTTAASTNATDASAMSVSAVDKLDDSGAGSVSPSSLSESDPQQAKRPRTAPYL